MEPPSPDPVRVTLDYHERSKHHPGRYAASLGYLDWSSQPDPFRTYQGAPRVELPLGAERLSTGWADLFERGAVAPAPLTIAALGTLFELALGITAWKRYQSARWALRANPSSGNLHPTEGWALLPALEGLPAGVHHYVARDHLLERRCTLAAADAAAVARRLGPGGFAVLLSTIHWREAWKYGERAFRYCQHDLGHALGSFSIAAAALGWSAAPLDGLGDERIAALLGLDRPDDSPGLDRLDREQPETALWIAPTADRARARAIESAADELVACARRGRWAGRANPLSAAHVDWPVIEQVAAATRRAPGSTVIPPEPARAAPPPPARRAAGPPAGALIRQRRSAVAFDGATAIAAEAFFRMLDATLPRPDAPPWSALPAAARIHLALLVHRVRGLVPGLYLLERDAADHDDLLAAIRAEALWGAVAGAPPPLRLFLLLPLDLRDSARIVSCAQEIAADGAFSLGMVASFEPVVRAAPSDYRRLFWEAGAIGQVLYLEAEAAGVRATGIGCYFDDLFHELLGLRDARFQSMYHFSVGGPVDDPRLQTEPPYADLAERRAGA